MSEKNVHLNEEVIKGQIKELVRDNVKAILNEMLKAEAEKLSQPSCWCATRSVRATIAVTITETLPQPSKRSRSMCPVSRAFPLSRPSLSVIVPVKAA